MIHSCVGLKGEKSRGEDLHLSNLFHHKSPHEHLVSTFPWLIKYPSIFANKKKIVHLFLFYLYFYQPVTIVQCSAMKQNLLGWTEVMWSACWSSSWSRRRTFQPHSRTVNGLSFSTFCCLAWVNKTMALSRVRIIKCKITELNTFLRCRCNF